MSTKRDEDRAKQQAGYQFASVAEMIKNLENAQTDEEREEAEQAIFEDPLSVEMRSDWHVVGDSAKDTEYNILLCTGGPAVRIIGDLNEYQEPETARLEYQDWFTKWEEYHLTEEETEVLLKYASMFYFAS